MTSLDPREEFKGRAVYRGAFMVGTQEIKQRGLGAALAQVPLAFSYVLRVKGFPFISLKELVLLSQDPFRHIQVNKTHLSLLHLHS